ncbi:MULTISPECIES: hypothetical protein [Streptomyces]|jgi:hypothetical protein|uniref:hypothetical protein n=1 Tax=Streptomyces TaxID=1883 RepID=UPI000F7417AD|nr:hypothetical protein [Streptomyces sp. WAC05292]RSS83020.1 hypothetical protein EF903_26370 [Streptomyces sp. WAC05292]
MYEMHLGEATSGPGPVWHVVARDRSATLCGRPLVPAGGRDTDRHCLPCMSAFRAVMTGEVPQA